MSDITVTQVINETSPAGALQERFTALTLSEREQFPYTELRSWTAPNLREKINTHWPSQQMVVEMDSYTYILATHPKLGYLQARLINSGGVVQILTYDAVAAETLFAELGFAKPKPREDKEEIIVNFKTKKTTFERRLATPKWDTVQANYPAAIREAIQPLFMEGNKLAGAGKLILWHGLPGTGKTYALRALGFEWRKWCDFVYITDPEMFFGDSDYMLNTLLSGNSPWDGDDEPVPVETQRGGVQSVPPRDRWKLIVCEDTGELLSTDAKDRSGQGLSRLLNIVDGMIGQGLKIMVLITTNEQLEKLHPAVKRPGRCANLTEFVGFEKPEAEAWLAAQGVGDTSCRKGITLSELFALKEQRLPKRPVVTKVGFAA